MKYTVVPKHTLQYVIRQLAPVIKALEVNRGFAVVGFGFFPHPAGLGFHPGSPALSVTAHH